MTVKAIALLGVSLISLSVIQPCPAPIPLIVPLVSMVAPIVGEIIQAGINVAQGKSSKLKRGSDTDPFVDLDVRMELPTGIHQHDVDLCKNANKNSTGVKVIQESDTCKYLHIFSSFLFFGEFQLIILAVRVENVEPECMVLASLFKDESTPQPCGSDCLKYVNVDPKHVNDFIAEAKKYL
jgi:hypothetical protein